ncbi:MAG: hypothetical protein KQH57_02560 [Actinomycetales bacterium]|nr:hypothetical protein [Actinomycetales bacterium]
MNDGATTDLELRLRGIFADDAARAPQAGGLSGRVRRRVRRGRAGRVAGVAAAAVAVLAVGGALLPGGLPWRSTSVGTVPPSAAGQAVGGGGEASCAWAYSPQAVAEHADLVLDGTVTRVGPRWVTLTGMPFDWVDVTLQVNRWLRGGSADSVVISMPAPAPSGVWVEDQEGAPQYWVGTRLLVSATARSADQHGSAAGMALWGCGGFTRYYSPEQAALWAAAVG